MCVYSVFTLTRHIVAQKQYPIQMFYVHTHTHTSTHTHMHTHTPAHLVTVSCIEFVFVFLRVLFVVMEMTSRTLFVSEHHLVAMAMSLFSPMM